MGSVWLVFGDCGFHSVCPLTDKGKRLMEASWWERLSVGETGFCSDVRGHAQFSSSSVQSLSSVQLFGTPWTAAWQAFLPITNSQSLLKLTSIESVMPSNHLILCGPLLLLPSIFRNIRVFSNELTLRIRWPKYWSFSFGISPSSEYSGLISFRIDSHVSTQWNFPGIAQRGCRLTFLEDNFGKNSEVGLEHSDSLCNWLSQAWWSQTLRAIFRAQNSALNKPHLGSFIFPWSS